MRHILYCSFVIKPPPTKKLKDKSRALVKKEMKSSFNNNSAKKPIVDDSLLLPRLPTLQRSPTPNSTESAQELLSVLKTKTSPSHQPPPAVRSTTTPASSLEALLGVLKDGSNWEHLLAVGIDLETFGLPLDQPEPLVLTAKPLFASMRRSSSSSESNAGSSSPAAAKDDLSALLPPCYAISNLPPASSKVASFSEETLFYTFYSMPRDRLQELAARELTNSRNWRYWITQRIWVTSSSASASNTSTMGDTYLADSFWDVSTWSRTKKEVRIPIKEIEDRFLININNK